MGHTVSDSLASTDVRAYALDLTAGQFVAGSADQQSVDIVITVYGPDGGHVGTFDLLGRGPEPFQFSSEASGIHRVEVTPFQGQQGRYALTLQRMEPLAETPVGRVDQFMAAYDHNEMPGAVILVMRGGEVVLSKAYGMASLEHGVPITPATVFDAASLAKQFTGLAIVMLYERGALSLDEDIRTYLPDMPDYGTPVTVRHLVHHTSGVRDWAAALPLAGQRREDVITYNDVLEFARRQRELNFEPGTEMSYSNTGYVLLARVVEAVTGQPFAEWTRDNIFAPLEMIDTRFLSDHGAIISSRTSSYGLGPYGRLERVSNNLSAMGSSSLLTTAEDLGKWLANFGHQRVGGSKAHALMRQPGVLSNGDSTSYAFGISIYEYRGLEQLSHDGGWAGMATVLYYYPEADAGIIVLSNFEYFNVGQTGDDLVQIFLGDLLVPHELGPNDDDARGEVTASWSPSTEALEEFVGRYFSPELEAYYTVAVEDGQLVASHRRLAGITLAPQRTDTFRGSQWFFHNVTFERDNAGSVTGMRVSNGRIRNLLFERQKSW